MRQRSRDALNLLTQVLVKGTSVPFGLIMIGWAARILPTGDKYLLLATPNILVSLGLLQLGLGYLIFKITAHEWASTGKVGESARVRGAFWIIVAISTSASIAVFILSYLGAVPAATVPVLVLGITALWTAVSDYVRLAIGEVFKTNILMMSGYFCSAAAMYLLVHAGHPSPALIFVLALGPVYFSNAISFLLLLRHPYFRQLLSPQKKFPIIAPLRETIPMMLYTIGSLGLLNLPLAGHVFPAFPALSLASLACLRIVASAISTYGFIIQPITPVILRLRYRLSASGFFWLAGGLICGMLTCGFAVGIAFAWLAPVLIKLWLQIDIGTSTALQWGLILSIWTGVMTTAAFCQVTSRANLAAFSLNIGLVTALLLPYLPFHMLAEQVVISGLVVSLCSGLISTFLAIRDPRPTTDASDVQPV